MSPSQITQAWGCEAGPHQAHAALPEDAGGVVSAPVIQQRVRHVRRPHKRRVAMRKPQGRREGADEGAAAIADGGKLTHTGRGRAHAGGSKGVIEERRHTAQLGHNSLHAATRQLSHQALPRKLIVLLATRRAYVVQAAGWQISGQALV
jgi:hypothetical protein